MLFTSIGRSNSKRKPFVSTVQAPQCTASIHYTALQGDTAAKWCFHINTFEKFGFSSAFIVKRSQKHRLISNVCLRSAAIAVCCIQNFLKHKLKLSFSWSSTNSKTVESKKKNTPCTLTNPLHIHVIFRFYQRATQEIPSPWQFHSVTCSWHKIMNRLLLPVSSMTVHTRAVELEGEKAAGIHMLLIICLKLLFLSPSQHGACTRLHFSSA